MRRVTLFMALAGGSLLLAACNHDNTGDQEAAASEAGTEDAMGEATAMPPVTSDMPSDAGAMASGTEAATPGDASGSPGEPGATASAATGQ